MTGKTVNKEKLVLSFINQKALAMWLFFFSCITSATTFKVTDRQGAPLAHAVISILFKQSSQQAALSRFGDKLQKPAVMDQENREFVPYVLSIKKGQKVIFPNHDRVRHHVYSFSKAKRFEIKLYAGTPSKPVLFDKSGVVVLGCNIHDAMLAYIFVDESPASGVTNLSGQLDLDLEGLEIEKIKAWHPDMGFDATPLLFPPPKGKKAYALTLPVH